MREDQQSYARASSAALVGFLTQLVLAVGMAVLGVYAASSAFTAMTWHFLGGLGIWAVLWVVYKQHQSERAEALEAEQLARADARTAALFEEAGAQLHAARKRLEYFYKYLLPGVSLALGLYLLAVGAVLGWQAWQAIEVGRYVDAELGSGVNAVAVALTAVIAGFVGFLVSRYVAGMTQVDAWVLLRGGAGYLMGNAAVAVLGALAALLAVFGVEQALVWLSLLVPAVLVLLGSEMVMNFVLGVYRPRRAGEVPRPGFDSRLLGWLTRPESMGKIVSETLNYQFGFEVSRSWFYRLLARAMTPLLVVALLVLWLLSGVVVVAPQQQAVMTTFGSMGASPRVVDAGLHLKWPWPIGGAEKFDVHRVQAVLVGSKDEPTDPGVAILWTNEHADGSESYLLTAPAYVEVAEALEVDAPLGELVGGQVQVNYRITDVVAYARSLNEPERLLRYIAEREVSRYFAQHTIDELLKQGDRRAARELRSQIDARLDEVSIGLSVVSVNVLGVHPPADEQVAEAFQSQINVHQENATEIQRAYRDAAVLLAEVAGTQAQALRLNEVEAQLSQLRDELTRLENAEEVEQEALLTMMQRVREQEVEMEQLIERAGGEAAELLQLAWADRWSHALGEQAATGSFASHLALYRQAPRYYMMREYLEMLGEQLASPRKYIFAVDQQVPPLIRLQLDDRALDFDAILQD